MGANENKAVVQEYFDAFSANRFGAALDLTSDDFMIWGMGKTPEVGHRWDKETVRKVFGSIADSLSSPFRIFVQNMTAEDDRVAVQAVSKVELKDGTPYSNNYHFLFTFKDGKIARIEEYCCTHEVITVIHAARRTIQAGSEKTEFTW